MRIHWATGVLTYSTAQEAQRELKKHGLSMVEPKERVSPRHGFWNGWDGSRQWGVRRMGRLRRGERGINFGSSKEDTPRNHEHGLTLHYP
eukprot:superscaffoldBa00004609_g19175